MNDGTNKMRLAELRAQRRLAAQHKMNFHDEMSAAAKSVLTYKEKQVEAIIKKARYVLLDLGVAVKQVHLDLTPHYGGFAIVILDVALVPNRPPIGRETFRDMIAGGLDNGWQVGWMGTSGQIQFEFPTAEASV